MQRIHRWFLAGLILMILTAVPAARAQTACFPAPDGLIAWWDGDSVAGTSALDIEGSNDGTIVGGVSIVPGKVGDAFEFDGTGTVTTPLINSFTGGITFDVWVKTADVSRQTVITNGGTISSAESGIGIGLTEGDIFCSGNHGVVGANTFVARGPFITDNEFHHVACTWTGDTTVGGAKLYVDGTLVTTDTAIASISTSSRGLDIGRHAVFGFGISGAIDEVEVFGRVLNAAEIQAIFDAGSAGKCKDEDGDGFRPPDDCDESDPEVNPDATEISFNFVDENCDGNLGDCDPCIAWSSHGQYVRCVSDAVSDCSIHNFTPEEADAFVSSAVHSDIGKKGFVPPECTE